MTGALERNDNPSVISHISIGTNDFDRAVAFYDAVLPVLGVGRVMQFPGAVAYGKAYPEFWVQTPVDGAPATAGNGFHVGFIAAAPAAVDRFYEAALAQGAVAEGAPGPRPDYGEGYYGCFLRDPDGHKIEAVYWDMALAHPA